MQPGKGDLLRLQHWKAISTSAVLSLGFILRPALTSWGPWVSGSQPHHYKKEERSSVSKGPRSQNWVPMVLLDRAWITCLWPGGYNTRIGQAHLWTQEWSPFTQTVWLAWEGVVPQGKSGWSHEDKGTCDGRRYRCPWSKYCYPILCMG